ncbi:type IV pilin N-terminal domain-containing protein [Methanoregula sp.]|uniref:type IV pilin N-terminal domain-containing protein n=1 Tax=Methanoregula sp. TaxID=2052170 RepID=UPI003BB0776E
MQRHDRNSRAVSEVVGEMLMIGIVLILAAVFTSQLPNYLPSERSPSVTVMMSSNESAGTITLWHKGGDWVKVSTLKVIVSNHTQTMNSEEVFTQTSNPSFAFAPDPAEPDSSVFDLGGSITVDPGIVSPFIPLDGNVTIVLATDRAVLFSGPVSGGQP